MPFSRKSLVAVCTLATLSSVSFNAIAAEDNICSNPLKTVCTDTKEQRNQLNLYITNLKKEISEEASKNEIPRIAEMKKTIKPIHFIKRFLAKIRIRNQEIMNSAKRRITGFESVVTNEENINKIKKYMYQSIESSAFDSLTKEKMKGIIESVVVGNFSDFLKKSNLEDNVLVQMLGNACGSDGLVSNAFATELKGEKYVLVCPGFLISATQENESDRFNSVLQVLAHEMGHHIDNSKIDTSKYVPYLVCLAKNYPESFKRTKEDEKFCKKNDETKCNVKVVLSHAGELIADQWGINVTAAHAKEEALSFENTNKMLTDSWSKLCGSGDEGIHPTGDFRIGTLMRKNPSLNEYLGCSSDQSDAKPGCSFAGDNTL